MIRVRVVEADNLQPLLARLALDADQLLRRNLIAAVGGIGADIFCACDGDNMLRVLFHTAQQYAATFVGIGLLSMLAERVVLGCADAEHGG